MGELNIYLSSLPDPRPDHPQNSVSPHSFLGFKGSQASLRGGSQALSSHDGGCRKSFITAELLGIRDSR